MPSGGGRRRCVVDQLLSWSTLRDAFDGWQDSLTSALVELGIGPERAPSLALMVITAIEGAIVLARVRRDMAPLDNVVDQLGPVLDRAVPV